MFKSLIKFFKNLFPKSESKEFKDTHYEIDRLSSEAKKISKNRKRRLDKIKHKKRREKQRKIELQIKEREKKEKKQERKIAEKKIKERAGNRAKKIAEKRKIEEEKRIAKEEEKRIALEEEKRIALEEEKRIASEKKPIKVTVTLKAKPKKARKVILKGESKEEPKVKPEEMTKEAKWIKEHFDQYKNLTEEG